MPVRSIQNDGQGDSAFICQNASFCPHFFPGRSGLPNRLMSQWRFYHTPIAASPTPADSFYLVIFRQAHSPDFPEKTRFRPCLKIPAETASGAIRLPLDACPQNVKNALQRISGGQRFASLPRLVLADFVRVAFRPGIGNYVLYFLPKLIGNCL